MTIDPHHSDGEQLNEQHDGKRAEGRGRRADMHIGKTDADHEIDHHRYARKEDAACHSFTIKHKEEGEIDQCRTRLTLQHDAHHRQEYQQQGRSEMAPLLDVVAIGGHEFGECQSSGELRKLSRLQT